MKVKLLILLFISALVYSSCGGKNTVPTTQSSDTVLSTPVSDYSMMITAKLNIKPEKTKDFIEAAKEMIEKSNNETGCKSYQLYQDPYDNTKFIFVEEYKSQSAIDEHFASDYFKAFGPKIADLIVEPAKIKIISVSKEVNQ